MESHDLITREMVPRELALRFLATLARCSQRELDTVVDWVQSGAIRLSLSDCAQELVEFAEKKGVKIAEATSILDGLFSLEGLRSSLDWSGPALLTFLIDAAAEEKTLPESFAAVPFKKTLERFFSLSDKLGTILKAQNIYDGALPNFESCSSLVEFRPVFDESRKQIVSGIVTASLTIASATFGAKREMKQTTFQLDATDVDKIALELDRVRQKLVALKRFAERHTSLLNPSRSLTVEDD